MYISCPNCSTSYTIDGGNIDNNGRAVRCSKCGHTWQQYPVIAEPATQMVSSRYVPPPPQPPLPQPQPPPQYAPPPNYDPQHYGHGYPIPQAPSPESGALPPYAPQVPYPAPYPYPYPPPYPPPYPQPTLEPGAALPTAPSEAVTPSQPATEPVQESGGEPSPELNVDNMTKPEDSVDKESLPSDEELKQALGDDNDLKPITSASPEPKEDIAELSEEDLEDLQDPEPIDPRGGRKEEFEDAGVEPEDLPDPEPIRAVVDDAASGEKKRSFKGIIISLIILILLGGIIAGLIVTRHTVVSFWPGANGVLFDLIGLRVPQPGDGLELSLRSPQRKTEGGKDVIIFEVIIQNTTDQTQRVPTVISSLTDVEGNIVQEIKTEPSKPTLEAGKILKFTATFPNAPSAAKESIARWGDYPKTSSEDQKSKTGSEDQK